jgi:DNA-binding NarL/FixJ family response regulator
METVHQGVQRLRQAQGSMGIRITDRVLESTPAQYRSIIAPEVSQAIRIILPAGISRLESGVGYSAAERAVIQASAARLIERQVPLHVMVPAIMSALPECRFIFDFAFRGAGRSAMLVLSERMVTAVAEAAEIFVAAYCRQRLRDLGSRRPMAERAELRGQGVRLTERQAQVLELVAQGLSNEDIAGVLNTSVRTIRNHLYQIYPAVGVKSRSAATRWWWTTVGAG